MDKFQAMQAFVRVVETGSFTKAANTLDIPKPTLSRLIQSLESELDTKLLNRTTRKVSVTTDGAAYYERAVRLLGDLLELEGVMSKAKSNPRGCLKVDFSGPIGLSMIIPALPEFVARYPNIQLDIGISDLPRDLVADNIDCVVRTAVVSDQMLVARRLGEVRQILCATPDYWKRHGIPGHPADIDHTHVVIQMMSARTGKPFPLQVVKDGERVDVGGQRHYSTNNASATVELGLAGLGIVHAMTFFAEPHLKSGALVPAFNDWWADPIPLFVVYLPNRHLSTKVQVFVDWLTELFARLESADRKRAARP